MENNLVDMIINDESASDITSKIKEILYSKSAENIEALKPHIAASVFGENEIEEE